MKAVVVLGTWAIMLFVMVVGEVLLKHPEPPHRDTGKALLVIAVLLVAQMFVAATSD